MNSVQRLTQEIAGLDTITKMELINLNKKLGLGCALKQCSNLHNTLYTPLYKKNTAEVVVIDGKQQFIRKTNREALTPRQKEVLTELKLQDTWVTPLYSNYIIALRLLAKGYLAVEVNTSGSSNVVIV